MTGAESSATLNATSIEVQVFGDSQGHVVHPSNGDCSVFPIRSFGGGAGAGLSDEPPRTLAKRRSKPRRSRIPGAGTVEFIADASKDLYAREPASSR